jgi:hypothetical protein
MRKQTPLNRLRALIIEEQKKKYPNTPYPFAETFDGYKPEKKEKKRIERFCELMGHNVRIIENRGFRKDKTKLVDDVTGGKRIIGTVEFQRSGMKKGISDLLGSIKGKSVAIEVKRIYKKGKDRMSDDQKKYQQQQESDGGVYVIVSGFNDFIEWYDDFVKNI